LTVASARKSLAAISALDRPAATSMRISRSWEVSASNPAAPPAQPKDASLVALPGLSAASDEIAERVVAVGAAEGVRAVHGGDDITVYVAR
jgi:hypothetical protein